MASPRPGSRVSILVTALLAVPPLVQAQGCASITNATFGLNEGNGQANITVILTAAPTSTLMGYTFQLDIPADGTINVTRTRSALRLSTSPVVGRITTTWALAADFGQADFLPQDHALAEQRDTLPL
jgi:hypothetical protein